MSNQRYRNSYIDGCSHFCTSSVAAFGPLLDSEQARRIILSSWLQAIVRHSVLVEGFVIMPDHVHILVRGEGANVRRFMQYSLQRASRLLREALEAGARQGDEQAGVLLEEIRNHGKVWKERFRCVALSVERDVLVKLQYIHNNPVKRGLVSEPSEWRWSSYANYHGGEPVLSITLALSDTEGAAGINVCEWRWSG